MNTHLFNFAKARVALSLLFLAGMLSAQIALQFSAEKTRYLCFEPITVILQVSNISGNTLVFDGQTPDQRGSISFKVEGSMGRHPRQFSSLENPTEGLRLGPGETKQLRIILNHFFDMQREDNYTISAMLDHGRLPRTHISQPIHLEVQDGLSIMTKNIGLPSPNATSVIKSIKITLLRFADIDEDIYALRAEDEDNVYAVFRLGSFIDGEKPQLELDDSCLVLLLQIRPRLFTYYIFGFDGRNMRLRQKRFYVTSDGAPPSLTRDTGYLRIEHAKLAREGIDYVEMKDDLPK